MSGIGLCNLAISALVFVLQLNSCVIVNDSDVFRRAGAAFRLSKISKDRDLED